MLSPWGCLFLYELNQTEGLQGDGLPSLNRATCARLLRAKLPLGVCSTIMARKILGLVDRAEVELNAGMD